MSYKHEDFHPVLPNITDDSMKDVDEMPQQQKDGKNTNNENISSYNKKKVDGGSYYNSTVKKIIIGVLVVIIIILIILLIYQIYKYYNDDEPLTQPFVNIPGGVRGTAPPPKPPDKKNTVPTPHNNPEYVSSTTNNTVGDLPRHVRDLDNDVLSRYIKKGSDVSKKKNLHEYKEHSGAKHVEHNSMKENTVERFKHQSPDTAHIEKIIDITEESRVEPQYDDYTPSREDDLIEMRKDMDEKDSGMAKLRSIEEETEHDIIEDFMLEDDDDIASIKSEGGGCIFELTKGKNRGQQCGRKRVDDSKCSRHKHK
jgi:hypothetical protein